MTVTLPQRLVSVFTGAAGLDIGMNRAGLVTLEMCESWEPARRVLAERFPHIEVAPDVSEFMPAADYDILSAGFPCTDLSHAGGKAGIFGAQSGLVKHVFRIAEQTEPQWVVLENVPNLLHLHGGLGIETVTRRLSDLGFKWAYRTVDSRFTGVPQRRDRVILIASRVREPAAHLLGGDLGLQEDAVRSHDRSWGFYWTEGRNGLGLVQGAVPTLKGGSTIGLPSAPAVWLPDLPAGERFRLPSIGGGERMQGFEEGWTDPACIDGGHDHRWKLVGNAVTTGVGEWIAHRLASDDPGEVVRGRRVEDLKAWPPAAFGGPGFDPVEALASKWPETPAMQSLSGLVDDAWSTLSRRATLGFLSRIDESGRELPPALAADLEDHLRRTRRPSTRLPDKADTLVQRLRASGMEADVARDVRPDPAVAYRPALTMASHRVAVDIRACFWHGCPDHDPRRLADNPRWVAKRARVTRRGEEMVRQLRVRGWVVVTAWEHDRVEDIANRVSHALVGARSEQLVDAQSGRGVAADASVSSGNL